MNKIKTGARNKMSFKIVRLVMVILAIGLLLPYVACTNSGIGGYGQPCSKYGVCVDSLENTDNPELHVICCPNTSTCITEIECYGTTDVVPRGGENELCREDGSCDTGLICCAEYTPAICTEEAYCGGGDEEEETTDGDDDTTDGDIETTDGDVDQDIPVTFPETFNGYTCMYETKICQEYPWPTVNDLYSITYVEDQLWLAGGLGTVIQSDKETFDGWTGISNHDIKDIFSTGEHVWAVGEESTVLYYDGTDWSSVTDPAFSEPDSKATINFNGVYDDGTGDVFVIGDNSTLLKKSGDKWETAGAPTNGINYNDIWGIPGEITVIVGDAGTTVFSYDKTDFAADPRSTELGNWNLHSVWGSSKNNVIAVGDGGAILYFDGDSWVSFGDFVNPEDELLLNTDGAVIGPKLTTEFSNFYSIAGYGNDKIFIVGEKGVVYKLVSGQNPRYRTIDDSVEPWIVTYEETGFEHTHYWEKVETDLTTDLMDVTVTDQGEVYVVGKYGKIMATASGEEWIAINRFSEDLVLEEQEEQTFNYSACTGLFGSSDVIYTSFKKGKAGFQYPQTETTWNWFTNEIINGANDIWVNIDGKPYFFNERVYLYDINGGNQVLRVDADTSIINGVMQRAWGFGDGTMYAVGEGVIQYNTNEWLRITNEIVTDWDVSIVDGDMDAEMEIELEPETETETEVEITEGEQDSAKIAKNKACSIGDSISCFEWNAVWGNSPENPWVVGPAGFVAQRVEDPNDETKYVWRSKTINGVVDLTDIWGDDSDDIWVSGTLGSLWHFDGTDFEIVNIPSKEADEDFLRIWGVNSSQVFVLSSKGNIYYTGDGANFSQYKSGVSWPLTEIWGKSVDDMYFAGENGTILRALEAFQTSEKKKKTPVK